MVRARRVVRRPRAKKTTEYDSDDPTGYKNEKVPDKSSSKFAEDQIDEFHSKKLTNLLAAGVQMDSEQEDDAYEEEIMPLTLQDSDEEDDDEEHDASDEDQEETDMESDLDGKKKDDLPNDMAWGSKKRIYYNSDYTVKKGKTFEEVDAEDKEEEEEAINIQQRLASDLNEEDFDLNLLQEFAVDAEFEKTEKTDKKEERIVKDLNTITQKEKLKLLKKESPELLELIQDFKAKLTELKDEIQPLVKMVKDGKIRAGKGADYLITKHQLYLNYCTNISFYLLLKAKRIPAHSHPVIERLVTYRNLINELGVLDAKLAPQMRQLLSEIQEQRASNRVASAKHVNKPTTSTIASMEEADESELDEEAALRFYKGFEERLKLKRKKKPLLDGEPTEKTEEEDGDMDEDQKRGITYQMAKNKGLTPKRRKIDRNPRVKHREKYRRAKIRRKGQVAEVRREEARYSGEMSGIRAGVKKGIKLQ